MNRRELLLGASFGVLTAASFTHSAEAQMLSPTQWTDKNGLVRDMPKDANPLENELEKYQRCPYCGMSRKMWSHTRHLIQYEDDAVDGTCSIHCASISLALNMDRGPKAIYVGDAGSEAEVKPLVNADQATYVLDGSKPGTMAGRSKWAYADADKAKAAAMVEGAEATDFNGALRAAYADMAENTIMIRKRRAERRAREAGNN